MVSVQATIASLSKEEDDHKPPFTAKPTRHLAMGGESLPMIVLLMGQSYVHFLPQLPVTLVISRAANNSWVSMGAVAIQKEQDWASLSGLAVLCAMRQSFCTLTKTSATRTPTA
jgi:hypothetical protein